MRRQKLENLTSIGGDLEITYSSLTDLEGLEGLNAILHSPLTEREVEALELSLAGKTNSEMAEELFISKSTVKFHLRNTYGKLGVNNRKEALVYVSQSS